MSTRGVVAVGTLARWRGVYNDCDSYPTCLGQDLYDYLTREMTQGQKTLAEIGAAILKFDDWRNCLDPERKYHQREPLDKISYFTRRDIAEKGCGLEWVYIIDPKASAVHVLDLRRGPEPSRHVGDMTFTAVPDFPALECGANYERCHHMAWHHFPEIGQSGPQRELNTQEYLGLEPLEDRHSACAYIIEGRRYLPAGSGVHGIYALRLAIEGPGHIPIRNPDPTAWYESVRAGNGRPVYRPVSHFTTDGQEEPYVGVTWVFPPTKVNPQETFKSRESVAA